MLRLLFYTSFAFGQKAYFSIAPLTILPNGFIGINTINPSSPFHFYFKGNTINGFGIFNETVSDNSGSGFIGLEYLGAASNTYVLRISSGATILQKVQFKLSNADNDVAVPIDCYAYSLPVNSYIAIYITNVTDNDDILVRSGQFKVEFLHK